MQYHISQEAWNFIEEIVSHYQKTVSPFLHLSEPGTVRARVSFELIETQTVQNNSLYGVIWNNATPIYFLLNQSDFLEGMQISYQNTSLTDGHLEVDLPLLYGQAKDLPLIERISHYVAKEIQPSLDAHKGYVRVEKISLDGSEVFIRFSGGCQGCSMASLTLKNIFEQKIKEHFPQIKTIIDLTDHDKGETPYA